MCQLRRAATLPPVEQNGMIAAIVFSMQSRTQFDFASMETVHENILHKVCNSSIFLNNSQTFLLYYLNLDNIVHGFDQSKESYFGGRFVFATYSLFSIIVTH